MKADIIKQYIKSAVYSYSTEMISFTFLRRLAKTNLIIPYYHMVSDDEVLHIKNLYRFKTIKHFKDDLDFLLKEYKPINLFDLIKCIDNDQTLPPDVFLLTFDDGFREMYDIVAPILLEKGVPATFFINSGFIDNKELCYQHKASIVAESLQRTKDTKLSEVVKNILIKNRINFDSVVSGILSIKYKQRNIIDEIAKLLNGDYDDYLSVYKPYLSSDQINMLLKKGFTIGAHSIDHPCYALLDLEEQLDQTFESLKFIKESFSLSYGVFAFPHNGQNASDVSDLYFRNAHKSGLIDLTFGTDGMTNNIISRNLQRVSFEKPLLPARKILALQYLKYLYKK